MNQDDKRKFRNENDDESSQDLMTASRARNRTVMLSPEVTGQVRALLQSPESGNKAPKPKDGTGGFSFAHALNLNEKRDENPTLIHAKSDKTDSSVMNVMKRSERFEKPTQGSSGERIMHDKPDPFISGKPLSGKALPGETPQFGGKVSGEELSEGTDAAEFKSNTRPGRDRENNEKGGTLTTSRVSVPGLQKQIKPELAVTQTQSRSQSSFNEERGLLVKETTQRQYSTARIIGFLVSFDELEGGEVLELRIGRWLISSNAMNQKDTIIIEDDSISALHAVVKVFPKGEVQVLDQLSENGTGVMKQGNNGEDDASQGIITLGHGDVIRFGKRYFVYCAVPKIQISE